MQITPPGFFALEVIRLHLGNANSHATMYFDVHFVKAFGHCAPDFMQMGAAGFILTDLGGEFICVEGVEDIAERMAVAMREQEKYR